MPMPEALAVRLADIPLPALLAVAAVLVLQRVVARAGMWAYALFALPGTAAHELAHYAVAFVLGARPQRPRLWPEPTAHGWRLGAVAFVPRWWRTGAIALAPLLLLPASIAWLAAFAPGADGALLALHAWVAGTLLNASLPSRADLRLAAPTLGVLALAAGGALLVHAAR
ncbi:hypothetical protein [Lysobacter humi (ex Lee et al. 2017)]